MVIFCILFSLLAYLLLITGASDVRLPTQHDRCGPQDSHPQGPLNSHPASIGQVQPDFNQHLLRSRGVEYFLKTLCCILLSIKQQSTKTFEN